MAPRKPLSAAQQIALNKVKDARRAWREAKDEIEERVRNQVREELQALEMTYALSIRRARELEVPITRIGSEGMGTSDPHTVRRWLGKTERMAAQLASVDSALDVFVWEDRAAGVVKVRFENFITTAIEPDGYPEILAGVVKIDASQPNGWEIVTDPGDVQTELGTLTGWLTWEIQGVPRSKPGSLTSLLDQWVEESR